MNKRILLMVSLLLIAGFAHAETIRLTIQKTCVSLLTGEAQGPVGDLISTGQVGTGYTRSVWYLDDKKVRWFVKKDVHYSELQTSAEVISSNIYRVFGYNTPETVKFVIDGVHYAASKDIGDDSRWTDFSDMNTSEIRQLRVVAAFLKDWDRLGNPDNNLLRPDGTLMLLDFGGTLGSRARGRHKPGEILSDAIGSFEATEDVNVIYDSFFVQAKATHPWEKVSRDDALKVIEKFKQLSDVKIESIVQMAGYSNPSDRDYMITALKMRRDGIIRNLLSRFP